MNDLEEAIRVSRQAVAATPDDHPDLPILLYNLGNKLQSQYEKTGRMDELDEAIRLSRQAVEATPIENPSLTGWLSTLGNMLETRYGRTGHLDNLEEAIRVSRQAIEATPVGHPDLPIFLSNFENKLQIRYEQTGRMGGLGEVTSLSRQTSQAAPDDLRPPPSDSAHMHNRYVFSPYGGSYYPPSKYADLSETPRERTMSRHRVSRPRPSSSFHSNPPTVDSGTYSPLYGDNEPVERPVERGTSRDGYGRAVAAYIQDPDEDFYRMPPTIPLPMPKVKGKAAPQIHEARHFKPHEAQTSPAMPSQRRPSRSMDRDIERYRYLDRFNIGDLKAELPVVSDRSYSQMSRETALLERANSLRDSHRRSTSYQDNRRGAQVAVASSKRRQPTTYNYKDEPSSNMGDNLEDRDHEIKNYQAARSGRNPTDGEPSSAEAMLPKATTNRQGQRSRSNSSGGSGGSGTDEETEEDKETTLLANGVKMGFDRKTIEEQTINILAGETHNAIRLNIAGGRRPKQYVTRSNLDYAGGASRREFEDLRRTRGDSRSERGLRRSSQSTYGSTRTMHQSQYGQTRRINSIEEAKRLSPQAVDPGHKATSPEMTHEISSSQATGDRIVDKRLPGSDRDPGYASMLHTTTSTVSSEPASPVNFEMLPSEQPSKIEHIDDHEIQSPVSDIDKIGSQKSDETAYEEKTGKALLRVFLAEDPLFRTLCEKAILQMGQNRFAKNMRRLLKSYYKNLSVEAESEAERAAAKLLRSRQGRQRISQQLAVYILQQNDENWIVHRPDLQVAPEDKNRVEAWLTCNSERPLSVLEYEAPTPGIESSTSCSESDSDVDEFPNVSDLKLTLRGAWSFQTLLRDFMLLFLSPELKTVLLSIPKRHIWLSEAQDLSFVNWVKVWIEDRTETTWNWWPLESAKQPLKDGESRMFWICVSSNVLVCEEKY
ncbi:hypothetical protein N7537_011559 [Penicillium hordei]|uniref:Uncharacterized protein n=1 Tax=Penicillium hordei TaxID=40994 RepID=A0AAD6DM15_9EURO|nr:uncharacterized protein N7537_011559 [Penicillium hordei]KAJ5588881.1 hypothetical protein N7537_011559 [Penicillium hordei]